MLQAAKRFLIKSSLADSSSQSLLFYTISYVPDQLYQSSVTAKSCREKLLYTNSCKFCSTIPETLTTHLQGLCWTAVTLTEYSMYPDEEPLGCETGQLSQANSATQHLSGWLVVGESQALPHAWPNGRPQHVNVSGHWATCVMSGLEN